MYARDAKKIMREELRLLNRNKEPTGSAVGSYFSDHVLPPLVSAVGVISRLWRFRGTPSPLSCVVCNIEQSHYHVKPIFAITGIITGHVMWRISN